MTAAIRIWTAGTLIALASLGIQAAWAAEAIAPGGPGAAPSTPPGLLGKPQGAWAKADGALRGLVAEFAAHRSRGQPDEFRPSNTTLQFSRGRVVVDIVATEDPEALLVRLQRMGLESASRYGNVISGKLPVGAIARAIELQNLQAISAAHQPLTNAGIPESEGVQAMYADAVHGTGITGVGAVIGVLSDSFDHRDGYADGLGSGNLPPGILVLDDSANNGSGLNDEGRGMMELAYDVAPGADFAFHTAFGGQADFASGIVELADAGANIIVDDVIYFAEPMYQDGVIAQAVDEVVARGVPYFSSAGNFARKSYEADYANSGEPWYVQDPFAGQQYRGVLHDFDPGPGTDWHQDLQIPDYTSHRILSLVVQWDQPFASLSSGSTGAEVDLDVYLTDTANPSNLLASSVDNNAQHNGGTGEPIELLQFQVGGCDSFLELFNGIGCVPDPGTFRLQIAYYDGGTSAVPGADPIEPTRLKYVLFDRNIGLQHATNSSTTFGHANAAGAMAVAAAFWQATPAWLCDYPPEGATHDDCEQNAEGQVTPKLESFSSAGGTRIFFDVPAGNQVDELRLKPEVTGPDGANTSFFFSDSNLDADTFPNFFGTSASAPHVAAVAALMREANPALTPDEIYATLEDTALNMNPRPEGEPEQPEGFDFDTGWGFVQADLAVAAAGGGGDARPSVSLTAPVDDATVSGTVSVTADASDDNGVTRVEFFLNGTLMGTDTDGNDGWSTSWDTTTASEGAHTVTATATDTADQTASDSVGVTVDNVDDPPSVTVTAPADGATVSGSVTITADASDDRGVAQVEFFLDGTSSLGIDTDGSDGWSVSWDSTAASNGAHTISATTTDTASQTANDSVGVTVDNLDDPPSVSLTTPANGATVSGTVAVTADASDDQGVTQVEFFIDGATSLGVDTNGGDGWSVSWDSTTATNGAHTLTAAATDTASQTAGNSVNVTVDNSAPANAPPVASFTVTNFPCPFDPSFNGWLCQMDNTSTDDDGVPTDSWEWDYGDGTGESCTTATCNTATYWSPAVLYEAPGTYTVMLTVTDSEGLSDSDSLPVSMAVSAYLGDLDANSISSGGRWDAEAVVLVLDDRGAPLAGAQVAGGWSNGANGGGNCTTGSDGWCTITKSNLKNNVDSVTFTVEDVTGTNITYASGANENPDGDSYGASNNVIDISKSADTSTNNPPVASFTVTENPCPLIEALGGWVCQFNNTSTDDGGVPTESWAWDYGDGTNEAAVWSPTAVYESATTQEGFYTVTLTVTDSQGASDSTSVQVQIGNPPPPPLVLESAVPYKVKGVQTVDLTWSGGSPMDDVEIHRTGASEATVPTENDGFEVHDIGAKGGGTYDFSICELGGLNCSDPPMQVTF